jgi:hypothetical protein
VSICLDIYFNKKRCDKNNYLQPKDLLEIDYKDKNAIKYYADVIS